MTQMQSNKTAEFEKRIPMMKCRSCALEVVSESESLFNKKV